uniref:Uncharacterized protein n=1 Tax=Cacopsylla melanoneura TaxID=428564 RepID=A0A8D8UT37_9HEMI
MHCCANWYPYVFAFFFQTQFFFTFVGFFRKIYYIKLIHRCQQGLFGFSFRQRKVGGCSNSNHFGSLLYHRLLVKFTNINLHSRITNLSFVPLKRVALQRTV